MERFIVGAAESLAWSIVGVVLLTLAYRVFDRLDPIDYSGEVRKGNLAAGVVMAALILGTALIIFAAIMPAPPTAR